MPRPAPVDYLQPDEKRLCSEPRHPLSVVDEVIGILVFIVLVGAADLVFVFGFYPGLWLPVGLPVLVGITLLGAAWITARWWHTRTSLYTLTDTRVYKAYGRLRWFLLQTTFDKVTDLHVRQGIFGRLWGYGTIRLETAGTGLALAGVRDPFEFKQRIEAARTGFLHTLVAEAAEEGARVAVPTDQPSAHRRPSSGMGEPLWRGAPVVVSALSRLLGTGFMFLIAVSFGAVALMGRTGPGGLIGAGLAAVAVLQALGLWAHLRFTRYHVHEGGVVVTGGWLTRRRVETTYSKVTDVTTTQGVIGRLFGFGDIRINTAGSNEAPVIFQGIRDPEGIKHRIDLARGAA